MSRGTVIRDTHRKGFEDLNEFWKELNGIEAELEAFSETALGFVEDPADRLLEKIRSFEPSVSIIGQIKAGKSTLLNTLIGETSLLPSDVNPWTSVITALHLNSRHRPANTRAVFRFFDAHEWDRLVSTGGRLGEMAARAGFEAEAGEVREQVTAMRTATETRLGAEFDQLLGGSRAFPTLDKDTIDRYICYGDPDDLAEGSTEGVYADLTKSADLYVDLEGYPTGLCLRDTPGVNDTFMMREQITLNAISDSRVCVVVLSAHQALSTMDLALLRIICSVEAREVLIFVNRMDELADPGAEQKNIARSIRKTLGRMGLEDGIEILFGSGYWAKCALDDSCADMMPASRAALASLYATSDVNLKDPVTLKTVAMAASGVQALHRAIARRVVDGPGKAILADVKNEFAAIKAMDQKVRGMARRRTAASPDIGADVFGRKLDALGETTLSRFDAATTVLRGELNARLEQAQQTFVDSALDALRAHIKTFGEYNAWSHDPNSLRMMMRSSFNAACSKLRKIGEEAFEDVFDGIQDILECDLGMFQDGSAVDFPEQPQHRAPTVLARTLTLDLQGAWWRKFWRFRSRKQAEKRYRALIVAETTPLIEELLTGYFDPAAARTRDVVQEFLDDQGRFATAILDCATEAPAKVGSDSGRSAA